MTVRKTVIYTLGFQRHGAHVLGEHFGMITFISVAGDKKSNMCNLVVDNLVSKDIVQSMTTQVLRAGITTIYYSTYTLLVCKHHQQYSYL